MDTETFMVPAKEQKSYEVDYDSFGQQAVEKLVAREVDHICGIFGVDVSYLPEIFLALTPFLFGIISRRWIRLAFCCGI
jgi:hypothetical protein